MTEDRNIKSIVKATNIINLLAKNNTPLSLAYISAEMEMSKSTVHGIISTLVNTGFLVQAPDSGKYQLGTRLFEIGMRVSERWSEKRIAYPFITRIVAETKETVHMAILDNNEVLYIAKQESTDSVKTVSDIGIKLPSYCSGVGKVLLSGLSKRHIQQIADKTGLKKYTEFTITDFQRLWVEMEKIRRQGFAIDNQEYQLGLRCIAVPIRNSSGNVTAALSISGPISRMNGKVFERNKMTLMKISHEISHKMGYSGIPAEI